MRKAVAFNFIPELIGDFTHVMELSGNPKALYVEAAVRTLHTAVEVFSAFEEYRNTKNKIKTMQAIQQKYCNLKMESILNDQTEELRRLDNEYKKLEIIINNGRFQDRGVREFIRYLQAELWKIYDIFQNTQIDSDYPERQRVDETARRVLRDHNKLLTIYF